MAKKTQRASKRLPKAKPAAGEAATAHSLTGSAVTDLFGSAAPSKAPSAFALLGPAVDPFTEKAHCRGSARNLFDKIKEHHGIDFARQLFRSLGAERKLETPKRLRDLDLWTAYEVFRKHRGVGLKKVAHLIYTNFVEEYGKSADATEAEMHLREEVYGSSAGATLQRIKRLQRERRKKS
jgi:hypothetical protein